MSRTDKTKPWWVRVAEHDPRAIHDHRDGICDLPPTPISGTEPKWKWTGCHWGDHNLLTADCCRGSNCRCCGPWAYDGKRKERYDGRAQARQVEKDETQVRRPARKDTVTWCKGKIGRRHVEVIRVAAWASWKVAMGKPLCYQPEGRGWPTRYQCGHEAGCSVCGKILRWSVPEQECPLWPLSH